MQLSSTTTPRTSEELHSAARRLRSRAASIRRLLADPGDGRDILREFIEQAPAQARRLSQLARALEAIA